jgi:hypothetical protein
MTTPQVARASTTEAMAQVDHADPARAATVGVGVSPRRYWLTTTLRSTVGSEPEKAPSWPFWVDISSTKGATVTAATAPAAATHRTGGRRQPCRTATASRWAGSRSRT